MKTLKKPVASVTPSIMRLVTPSVKPVSFKQLCKDWQLDDKTLLAHWLGFVVASMQQPTEQVVAIRKFTRSATLVIPGSVFYTQPGYDWPDLVFTKHKQSQLNRNYFNQENIQAANDKLRERLESGKSQTSVAAHLAAAGKDKRSQGFCMQSCIVSHYHKKGKVEDVYIDMTYRVTEAAQKFGADLLWLHRVLIPAMMNGLHMKFQVKEVRFHFANVYISPVWMPCIYAKISPSYILDLLPPERWRAIVARHTKDLCDPTKRYAFVSQQKMYDFFNRTVKMTASDRVKLRRMANADLLEFSGRNQRDHS